MTDIERKAKRAASDKKRYDERKRKAERAAYFRDYRAKMTDEQKVKVAAQRKVHDAAHHEAHREQDNARSRAYVAEYHQKVLAKARAKAAKKKAQRLYAADPVRRHQYNLLHLERIAVSHSKRRAAKYGNTPISEMLTSTEWLAILTEADGHCTYCSKKAKLTLDHVIPLSKGGKHSKDNVVPACLHCNSSKNNKTLEEWLGKKHKATIQAIETQLMEVHRG
jgi:5-methylcytosine-specific restriction endonuclease McrA